MGGGFSSRQIPEAPPSAAPHTYPEQLHTHTPKPTPTGLELSRHGHTFSDTWSALSSGISTQGPQGLLPRAPEAYPGKHRHKPRVGGRGSVGYSPHAGPPHSPSGSAHVQSLSEGEAPQYEQRTKDSSTSQSSLQAPDEPGNESQLIHLNSRLK